MTCNQYYLCCWFHFLFCVCLCSRLESLQKKHRKLQSDRVSAVPLSTVLESLLQSDPQHTLEPVIRDSCALTSSFLSMQLPAVSELKSDSRHSHSAGMLPLPVQNLNLEIIDSNDASVLPCTVSTCSTSSFTDAATVVDEVSLAASEQQASMSVKMSAQKLPAVSSAQQCSVLMPANGLVIPVTAGDSVVKSSAAHAQRLVPHSLATSERAVTVAPSTSATTNNVQSSGKMASVKTPSGQFVHLTIPTMLNLTGTNIQIRQLVSIPPRVVSPVCAGTGISSVPCTMVNVACTQPSDIVTTTNTCLLPDSIVSDLLQQSAVSFQWFQTPPELQSTPVSCSHIASDELSTELTCCSSVCCHGSAGVVAVSCSTPPACHDEDSRLDSMSSDIDAPQLSLLHGRIIPDIPTPDPSCSSQE